MREFQKQMTRFGPNILPTVPRHQISLGGRANNLHVSKDPKNKNLKFLVTAPALRSVMQISPRQLQHSSTWVECCNMNSMSPD